MREKKNYYSVCIFETRLKRQYHGATIKANGMPRLLKIAHTSGQHCCANSKKTARITEMRFGKKEDKVGSTSLIDDETQETIVIVFRKQNLADTTECPESAFFIHEAQQQGHDYVLWFVIEMIRFIDCQQRGRKCVFTIPWV